MEYLRKRRARMSEKTDQGFGLLQPQPKGSGYLLFLRVRLQEGTGIHEYENQRRNEGTHLDLGGWQTP